MKPTLSPCSAAAGTPGTKHQEPPQMQGWQGGEFFSGETNQPPGNRGLLILGTHRKARSLPNNPFPHPHHSYQTCIHGFKSAFEDFDRPPAPKHLH